jgi:hypothetical protein
MKTPMKSPAMKTTCHPSTRDLIAAHLNRGLVDQVAAHEEARNLPLRCDENDCFVFFSELDGNRRQIVVDDPASLRLRTPRKPT